MRLLTCAAPERALDLEKAAEEAGKPFRSCGGPVCSRLAPMWVPGHKCASCAPPGRRWSGSPGACSSCRRARSSRAMRRCWAACAACSRPARCGRTRTSWPRARACTWRRAGPSAGRRAAPGGSGARLRGARERTGLWSACARGSGARVRGAGTAVCLQRPGTVTGLRARGCMCAARLLM